MKHLLVLVLALVLTAGLFAGASAVNTTASISTADAKSADGCCPSESMDTAAKSADSGCCSGMESATETKSGSCGSSDAAPISTPSAGECPAVKSCPSTGSTSASATI